MVPSLSASAGGGGPSASGSNAGVQTPNSNPFNFDGSGWVVNIHSDGNTATASGSKDANGTQQTGSPGGAAGLLAGIDPLYLVIGGVVFVLMMRRR